MMECGNVDGAVQRNPWLNEGSLESLRNVLAIADSAGVLPKLNVLETEDHQKELYHTSPSLKMIKLLREIKDLKTRLHQVNFEIQQHLQDKETKDITHADILEQRIAQIKESNCHLEAIVRQKDALTARLQKPFAGDYLRVEASYQRYACEVLPQLVPNVSDLPIQLENIDWAVRVELAELESMLSDVTGTRAGQQTLYQNMTKQRQAMQSLASKVCSVHEISTGQQ